MTQPKPPPSPDATPSSHYRWYVVAMLWWISFFNYADRPGMVGTVGGILGAAGVNIAGMQVARDAKGGHALVAMAVDTAIPADTLLEIETAIDAVSVRAADLV